MGVFTLNHFLTIVQYSVVPLYSDVTKGNYMTHPLLRCLPQGYYVSLIKLLIQNIECI